MLKQYIQILWLLFLFFSFSYCIKMLNTREIHPEVMQSINHKMAAANGGTGIPPLAVCAFHNATEDKSGVDFSLYELFYLACRIDGSICLPRTMQLCKSTVQTTSRSAVYDEGKLRVKVEMNFCVNSQDKKCFNPGSYVSHRDGRGKHFKSHNFHVG